MLNSIYHLRALLVFRTGLEYPTSITRSANKITLVTNTQILRPIMLLKSHLGDSVLSYTSVSITVCGCLFSSSSTISPRKTPPRWLTNNIHSNDQHQCVSLRRRFWWPYLELSQGTIIGSRPVAWNASTNSPMAGKRPNWIPHAP